MRMIALTKLQKFAAFSGLITAAIGLVAILGALTGWRLFSGFGTSYLPMSPVPGVAVFVLGIIMAAFARKNTFDKKDHLTSVVLLFIILAGLGISFGEIIKIEPSAGRSTLLVGLVFLFSSLSLFLKNNYWNRAFVNDFVSVAGIISGSLGLAVILAHVFDLFSYYGGENIPVSLNAGACAMFLGLGLVALCGDQSAIIKRFSGDTLHAKLQRMIVPFTVLGVLLQSMVLVYLEKIIRHNFALVNALEDVLFSIIFICAASVALKKVFVDVRKTEEERKKTERLLLESEERFRLLFNSGRDAVYVQGISKDGRLGKFIKVNDVAFRRLGYTNEELQDLPPSAIFAPGRGGWTPGVIEQLLKNKNALFETEELCKDGRRIPVEVSSSLFELDGGPAIISIVRDISGRRQTQKKLRESEEKFSKAFSESFDAIAISSMDGVYVEVNKGFTTLTGYTAEEAIGRSALKELKIWKSPEDRNRAMSELTEKGEINSFEVEIQNKRGETKITLMSGRFIEILGQKHLLTLVRDVTQQKKQEKLLKETKEQLALAVSGSRAGLWDWKIQTGEVILNERLVEILGYTLQELAPINVETWEKLGHPEDLIRSEELLNKHFAKETEYYECEGRMKHKDGRWIWILDRGKVK